VWTQAASKHVTCDGCYDRLRELIAEVAERFLVMDPRPGATLIPGMRGAPGFGSRSPASDHVIAMRDPRSSQVARVWVGGDGRVHEESMRPARSIHGTFSILAWEIAEHRDVSGPDDRDGVFALLRFIDHHLDYITRHAELAVEVSDTLHRAAWPLRTQTGDGRRFIGRCPEMVADAELLEAASEFYGETPQEIELVRCGAPLFAPRISSSAEHIECFACSRVWPVSEWLKLGEQLNAEVLRAVC
jgi:hypothetical protein